MAALPNHRRDQLLANSPVELCSGVDALYLSARGDAPPSLLTDLEVMRSAAEASDQPVDFQIGGTPMKVQPRAFGKYRYCLTHDLARIGFTPSRSFPLMRIQPTAMALHTLGPQLTVRWVESILDAAGIEATLHASRLDLHSDWQGIEIKANERSNFVTYSDRRALYEVAEEMSGLNFGKRGGKIYARIYDKSREAHDKGHDWWPDVWGAEYDREKRVVRFEFEFSREALVEFGVDTPQQALDRAAGIWAYATGSWLTLRVPTNDETRSRWPLDPRWVHVQGSSLRNGTAPAERIRAGEREGSLRSYRKLATGVLSSMALPMGTADIPDTLRAAETELWVYEKVTGRSFADRVAEKRQRREP